MKKSVFVCKETESKRGPVKKTEGLSLDPGLLCTWHLTWGISEHQHPLKCESLLAVFVSVWEELLFIFCVFFCLNKGDISWNFILNSWKSFSCHTETLLCGSYFHVQLLCLQCSGAYCDYYQRLTLLYLTLSHSSSLTTKMCSMDHCVYMSPSRYRLCVFSWIQKWMSKNEKLIDSELTVRVCANNFPFAVFCLHCHIL